MAETQPPGDSEPDRINMLPDELLQKIFSSISVFESLPARAVCKKWLKLLTTLPILDISLIQFLKLREISVFNNPLMKEELRDFIDWVLESGGTNKVTKLRLCSHSIFDMPDITRWVEAVAARGVEKVELGLCHLAIDGIELPHCLVASESLRVLKVASDYGFLRLPDSPGRFSRLTCLVLAGFQLTNDEATRLFFSNCPPLLEKLLLRDCDLSGIKHFEINSTTLLTLVLEYTTDEVDPAQVDSQTGIAISCPNLKIFYYNAPFARYYSIMSLNSIESTRVIVSSYECPPESKKHIGYNMIKVLQAVQKTKLLELSMETIWKLISDDGKPMPFPLMFDRLTSLRLRLKVDSKYVHILILLLKHSPKLEHLSVFSDEILDESESVCQTLGTLDEEIECLRSNLKTFELEEFDGNVCETELVMYMLKNGRGLEKICVTWMEDAEAIRFKMNILTQYAYDWCSEAELEFVVHNEEDMD